METFEYNPKGVCSSKMLFKIENDTIIDVKVIGGCPGNSLGVGALVQNQKIDDVIDKLDGIRCGFKNTSCPDQISIALKEYKQKRGSLSNSVGGTKN